ncbi:MAG: CDP-glycerol glycerophosphotransferase family protein, partial [Staphylococcus epidermidis]|nr:CDP-glycerol glycerophosphotransferase family protein [Staphylococcus epidermidis]
PSQKIDILPVGYPRNNYLLNRINDVGLHKRIFSEINIDPTKRVLLYAPTWKTNSSDDDVFPINEQLLKHYNVIYKGHVESQNDLVPEGVIIPPNNIETQDLIIISDVVLTDYSSIIFDALTVDKKGCLYTPNHSQYVEERGVYQDVIDTLKPVWYTDAELLMNDLITDSIPQLNNKYTNKNNQSFEYISKLISNQLK